MAQLTANELFRDALIRHQMGLMRVSGSTRNAVIALLDATEADLRAQIQRITSGVANPLGTDVTQPKVQRRLIELEKAVKNIRSAAFTSAKRTWASDLSAIAVAEPGFVAAAAQAGAPVVLDLILPPRAQLQALVKTNPFEGRTMAQWANRLERADLDRILNEVRIGMVQGDTPQGLARRVVGTARLRGQDGVTQITRRQAASITRTAVNHFSNQAKQILYEENSDLFTHEIYTATLDSRTTPICSSLDGEKFEIGKGPVPPLHFNCRSVRVAVIDDNAAATRPMVRSTEKGLLREFARDKNIRTPANRGGLPHGTKGQFDMFARRRTRELTGRTPASTTYQTFLMRQSAEFQNDYLGVTKGRLFRRGEVTLDRFVNRRGDAFTLRELAIREADAFRAAGLDPANFL